jgi:hypothetical protein
MVLLDLGRRIVDTLNKRVWVLIREIVGRGVLRRIGRTCDMGEEPLMGGLYFSDRTLSAADISDRYENEGRR